MENIKNYLRDNFEQTFILIILLTIIILNYYVPFKIAYLNFYFLPVIMAGYFLNEKNSCMCAIFCILAVTLNVIISPECFFMSKSRISLLIYIMVWGSFLILIGAIVGKLNNKLKQKIHQLTNLNEQLQQHKEELNQANLSLKDYSNNLESKVSKRTEELGKSKDIIERLKLKVEDTLHTVMDSTVAKLIIEGRLRNEKRNISVMFSDLVNFTCYSENKSPESVVRDINRYLSNVEPILLNFRSHIDKYIGDGIMCEFGTPLYYENYRLLAVLAAIKVQEKMMCLDCPWQMRIGISSGNAITGLIGYKRQSFTTIGDVVNLASRLEKICPPGSILIDRFTMEGVQRFIKVRLKQQIPLTKSVTSRIETELKELYKKLDNAPQDTEKTALYYQIGQLHTSLGEFKEAIDSYKHILQIQPDNSEVKLAYAEATIKMNQDSKIKIRGRKQGITAYEVLGIKDILLDREKISASFYKKYSHVASLINIPEDIILPIEGLEGCIGHSKAVALISYAVASEIGLSEQEQIETLNAGFVADIGKEIIPPRPYNAGTDITEHELDEIQKHPIESCRILKNMGYDSELMLRIIRHSHENYNGTGYPDGLKGEEIPLCSRIIAVADTYDAMTSWKPYREKWDRNATFDELKRGAEEGTFDHQVVDNVIRLMS